MEQGTIADIGLMLDGMNLAELTPSLWLDGSGVTPLEYRLEPGHDAWLIGRGDDSCVALPADEGLISRVHLRIERSGACFSITDLSRNGTRVNGAPVVHQRLEDGDRITLGAVPSERLEIVFRHARPKPPPRRSLELTLIDAPAIEEEFLQPEEDAGRASGPPSSEPPLAAGPAAAPPPLPAPVPNTTETDDTGKEWGAVQSRLLGLTLAAAVLGAILFVFGS